VVLDVDVSNTPADLGDGWMAGALAVVVILILIVFVQLGSAKSQKLPPGKKAPWTGRYEAPERKWSKKGETLPPTTSAGVQWQLKEAYSRSGWAAFMLLLAVLGFFCYSQVDTTRLQELISSPSAPEPSRPPPPHQVHHVTPIHHVTTKPGRNPPRAHGHSSKKRN
jgi:hypothetical protein